MRLNKHHNRSSETMIIPEHLIFEEILPFLPVKSLIRFKSVSKSWFSTISSPEFVKLHLQFSSPGSHFLLHSSTSRCEILYLRYNEFDCEIKDMGWLDLTSLSINGYSVINFVGSCDGLVCLVCYHRHMYMLRRLLVVWNPDTNQFRQINFPDHHHQYLPNYACSFRNSSSKDDNVLFAAFWSDYSRIAYCYMFSWSTGEWKSLCNLTNRFGMPMFPNVFLIGDVVYFLFFCDLIVGFSLSNEEVNESPRLHWTDPYRKCSPIQLRGRLSYVCSVDHNVSDVWMLKRHCDWNSWEKLYSVNIASADYYGVSETGKCLVHHEGKLKVVDLSCGSGTLKLSSKGIDYDYIPHNKIVAHGYFESLVSPF